MDQNFSPLQKKRLAYIPRFPSILKHLNEIHCRALVEEHEIAPEIEQIFPHTSKISAYKIQRGTKQENRPLKVGAIFSGGPASGGHNVLTGLFDALQQIHKNSQLFGFLGGFSGILKNQIQRLDQIQIDAVRNQGGFDLIGTGRAKLETTEELIAAKACAEAHRLDALIVIGGDDSNTNAAVLAEYLIHQGSPIQIIGIPKTIDGDLRSKDIELSFGFDTACKTYSEIIGNIQRDAISALKHYHFIKLMGRSASHITLECALLTHPNLALIGEEGQSLEQIVTRIADLIVRRKEAGKEYGVILVPEGLIEFVPEIRRLIAALNLHLAKKHLPSSPQEQMTAIKKLLGEEELRTFQLIPQKIQAQLLLQRDPHGNVKVSQIATEQLLIDLVSAKLKAQNFKGNFNPQGHFIGYEGRSALPTNFDADYAYSLGLCAAVAIRDKLTGVICAIRSLKETVENWEPRFSPLIPMLRFEERKGKKKAVIDKTLVDINAKYFLHFMLHRKKWEIDDQYCYPGPIQFFGDTEITDALPLTLKL